MGKAARNRRLRLEQTEPPPIPHADSFGTPLKPGEIRLANPVAQHFGTFIFGNALHWERQAHDELIRVAPDAAAELEPFEGILGFIAHNGRPDEERTAEYQKWMQFREAVDAHCPEKFVAVQDSAKGQHIVICGAGPTLGEHAAEWCHQGDQVWGVNSALPYLRDHGYKVTHGLTVDQTPQMCAEWFHAPDVEYLLATTVHPHLTEYLTKRGRRLRWFNNFVGIKQRPVVGVLPDGTRRAMDYETWLYSVLFQGTVRAGSGLNSVTRAIDVALFMGAERVTVLGADCCLRAAAPLPDGVLHGSAEHVAWLHGLQLHADGGHALASDASPLTFQGWVDGRFWVTKPDMMISAVWLAKMAKRLHGRLTLIGDTLPNAIRDKPQAFLDRLPTLTDSTGTPIPIDFDPEPMDNGTRAALPALDAKDGPPAT